MAVEVTIKKKGFFKRKIDIPKLVFENMGYGTTDDNWRLLENEIGEPTIVFHKNILERGIEIVSEKEEILLRLPLPTGEEEIRFFYEYIEKLCKYLKVDTFFRYEEESYFDRIEDYIKWDITASISAISSMRKSIEKKEYEEMYIFGVLNPIAIGPKELDIIDDNPTKLGEFLHDLQSVDAYYAGGKVYERENGTLFGMYVLTENVKSIFPLKPLIMNDDLKLEEWYVTFCYDEDISGSISYSDFLSNVDSSEYYDASHFYITLAKEQMVELLEKYKKEL